MESFALAADHSGAINHIHTVTISPTIIGVVREVRIIVTIAVVGWITVTGIRSFVWAKQGTQK